METRFISNMAEKKLHVKNFYRALRFFSRYDLKPRLFLETLRGYAELKGNSIDEAYELLFAHEIPEGEPDWFESGIEIRIDWPAVDEDVVIPLSYEEFYPMLCEECEKYLEERPEDRAEVQELLGRIKVALTI